MMLRHNKYHYQVPAAGGGDGGQAVDLSTALTGEALQPLLQNPEFLDKVKEFLPAGEGGKETSLADLSGTVQSPQFQQALSMFCMALSSGQLGPLIREFGLGEEAGGAADKVSDLCSVQLSLAIIKFLPGRHGGFREGSPEQGRDREER